MLGINSPRELVKGLFAQNVRDSLHRATTGNLTASEKRHTRISKMQVVNGILFGIDQLSISELKNPNKDTLRMFMTLYSKE